MSISDFGQGLLPISHSAYWFMTCYIILMLFSPYLNKLIKGLSKKSFSKIVLLSLFLWSIVPTIIPPMTSYPVQNIWPDNYLKHHNQKDGTDHHQMPLLQHNQENRHFRTHIPDLL